MSYSAFTDKRREPTATEILDVLGPVAKAWGAFGQHIRETYPVQEDFKFMYGKKYGWALRFRQRGSLLTSLYPASGAFVVQVILGGAALEQAQRSELGENARHAIEAAKPYPEGRWLFIRVESQTDIEDARNLVALKHAALAGPTALRAKLTS